MIDQPVMQDQSETDRAYYRRIASEYFQRHEQPIQKYSTRVESQWIRQLIRPNSCVLLVGVGGGRELDALLGQNCQVTALDYSEEMLNAGRQHWQDDRITWVLGDAHDLRQHRESYDATISLAALNYFIDVRRAFQEMGSSLVKDGRLIVSSINSLHGSERQTCNGGAARQVTRNLYSPDDLRQLAEDIHLKIELIRGVRYWCDLLPVRWNTSRASSVQRLALRAELTIEPVLQRVLGPRRAKFFWLVARR